MYYILVKVTESGVESRWQFYVENLAAFCGDADTVANKYYELLTDSEYNAGDLKVVTIERVDVSVGVAGATASSTTNNSTNSGTSSPSGDASTSGGTNTSGDTGTSGGTSTGGDTNTSGDN